jgi:flagellar P-ring protein precursor FlgI
MIDNTQARRRKAGVLLCVMFALVALPASPAMAQLVRIKDITSVEGQRTNVLTGMGLVAGVENTGGKSPVTRQLALNMIQSFGVRADPLQRAAILNDTRMKTNNLAAVTVMADMPVNAKKGSHLDIRVASIDDAQSLRGGLLLPTPLHGVDGVVYALAQGSVNTGGFAFQGDAATARQNHSTMATLPNGAIVEEEICGVPEARGRFRLLLRHEDYTTASRITHAINQRYRGSAAAINSGTIEIYVPQEYAMHETEFMASVGEMTVIADLTAKVVINERTGTVVIGHNVRIGKTALVHANLSITTSESPEVSQPAPFSNGVTAAVPRTNITVTQEKRPISVLEETVTVADLVAGLNALGVTPSDLGSIFQALHNNGALHAELVLE